jgi:hypothetical protein
MSMHHYTRIIVGVVLSPTEVMDMHIEYDNYEKNYCGASDVKIHFLETEEDRNLYCGIPIDGGADYDGTHPMIQLPVEEIARLKEEAVQEFARMFPKHKLNIKVVIFPQWI